MTTYPIGRSSTEEIVFRVNEYQFALVKKIKPERPYIYNQSSYISTKTIVMNERENLELFRAEIKEGMIKSLDMREQLTIIQDIQDEILKGE